MEPVILKDLDLTSPEELIFLSSYETSLFIQNLDMHIPTSDYPNNYLVKNPNAPFVGSINLGIRVLFNADP